MVRNERKRSILKWHDHKHDWNSVRTPNASPKTRIYAHLYYFKLRNIHLTLWLYVKTKHVLIVLLLYCESLVIIVMTSLINTNIYAMHTCTELSYRLAYVFVYLSNTQYLLPTRNITFIHIHAWKNTVCLRTTNHFIFFSHFILLYYSISVVVHFRQTTYMSVYSKYINVERATTAFCFSLIT